MTTMTEALKENNKAVIERMRIKREINTFNKCRKPVPAELKAKLAELNGNLNNGGSTMAKTKRTKRQPGESVFALKQKAKAKHVPYWFAMTKPELTTALTAQGKEALEKIVAPARTRYLEAQRKYHKQTA